jgi:hypothetical protein
MNPLGAFATEYPHDVSRKEIEIKNTLGEHP